MTVRRCRRKASIAQFRVIEKSHEPNRWSRAEPSEEPERPQERLLGDVLGEGPVAGEVPGEGEHVGLERAHELFEREQIAASRAIDGAWIGVPHSLPLSSSRHASLGASADPRSRSRRGRRRLHVHDRVDAADEQRAQAGAGGWVEHRQAVGEGSVEPRAVGG